MDLTYFTSVRALTGGLGSNRKVLVKGGLALPKVEITGITCGCLTRRGIGNIQKRVSIEVAWRIFPVGYLGLINRDYIAFL